MAVNISGKVLRATPLLHHVKLNSVTQKTRTTEVPEHVDTPTPPGSGATQHHRFYTRDAPELVAQVTWPPLGPEASEEFGASSRALRKRRSPGFLVPLRIIDNCVQNTFKYGDEGPRR